MTLHVRIAQTVLHVGTTSGGAVAVAGQPTRSAPIVRPVDPTSRRSVAVAGVRLAPVESLNFRSSKARTRSAPIVRPVDPTSSRAVAAAKATWANRGQYGANSRAQPTRSATEPNI